MTRLSSAPSPIDLAPAVYAQAIAPLEYLGFEDIPSEEEVAVQLDRSIALRNAPLSELLIVPPSAEILDFVGWHELLKIARQGHEEPRIAGLTIHESFRQLQLRAVPEAPTIGVAPSSEYSHLGNRRMTFAGYVIMQVARTLRGQPLEDTVSSGTRSILPGAGVYDLREKTFDRWKERTPEGEYMTGETEKGRYDPAAKTASKVVAEVRIAPADIKRSVRIAGWGAAARASSGFDASGQPEEVAYRHIPTGDKVIQVLPRNIRASKKNIQRRERWLYI